VGVETDPDPARRGGAGRGEPGLPLVPPWASRSGSRTDTRTCWWCGW